ncbi:MAG: OmpA family protein [Opitutaceae bacterium]|nr:OmpA family protein [Cytophagales bacterium]
MKKIQALFTAIAACCVTLCSIQSFSQCCNVVTSNGVSVISSNAICVSTVYASTTACLDGDSDGIMDSDDKCPTVKGSLENGGCPDTDGDKVIDKDDKCPNLVGLVTMSGCPDGDNDGITDIEDKCPTIRGTKAFAGCADTDGDAIADPDDKCPSVKGLPTYQGCPDTDSDGIQDSEDACPSIAGPVALGGCPDKDSDGVVDARDKCPDVAGLPEDKGCPKIAEEIVRKAAKSAKGVYFETAKDVIKKESLDDIEILVSILKDDATLICNIEGHTDNVGKPDKNLVLSQKRADACKNYMIKQGIDSSRLSATGFGDTVPVVDNKTKDGKSKNRRVEFKLAY